MIKKNLVFFIFLQYLCPNLIAQPTTFEKIYHVDNTHYYEASAIIQTTEGGYAFIALNSGLGNYLVLFKTDSLGDTTWTHSYCGFWGVQLIQKPDSGFMICSTTLCNTASGGFENSLISTNLIGDTLWSKSYGWSGSDIAQDMFRCKDNGYAVVSASSGTSPSIFKVDSTGFYQWGHLTSMIAPYSIKNTLDGGFIVAGWTGWSTAGWAIEKYDSTGAGQWGEYHGYSSTMSIDDRFKDVIQLPDSDFIVSGSPPLSLVKISHATGDTIWTRNIGSSGNGLAYTLDSNIIVVDGAGNISKYDTSGSQLWSRHFPNTFLRDIKPTIDGGFIACGGYAPYIFSPYTDILIIKTDSLGNVSSLIGMDESNISQSNSFVFPNPVTNTSQLNFLNPKNETFHFSVSDITGRVNEEKEIKGSNLLIEKGNKPQGVYFYSLFNSNTGNRMNGKFVIN